jgi:hypothetical protein
MTDSRHSIDQPLRLMQIIAGALIMGVVMFALIATLALGALNEAPSNTMIAYIGAGFAVMVVAAHLVVPEAVKAAALKATSDRDAEFLCGIYQTRMIIALALLEGAAFFNIVALMIAHTWWSLAIAGALLLLMLARFPTRTSIEHWIETQQLMSP